MTKVVEVTKVGATNTTCRAYVLAFVFMRRMTRPTCVNMFLVNAEEYEWIQVNRILLPPDEFWENKFVVRHKSIRQGVGPSIH